MEKFRKFFCLLMVVLLVFSSISVSADETSSYPVSTEQSQVCDVTEDAAIQKSSVSESYQDTEQESVSVTETNQKATVIEKDSKGQANVFDEAKSENIVGTIQSVSVSMNKSSATIEKGAQTKLSVNVSGASQSTTFNWNSSNKNVATVDSSGNVTGIAAGSATISCEVKIGDQSYHTECLVSVVKSTVTQTIRYNVMIIDTSNSIKGTPLAREKEAAKRFCKTVLSADGKNYVAVIFMNSSIKTACSLTSNYTTVANAISKAKASGDTNINAALAQAKSILSKKANGTNVMKNIILCSDGLPTVGTKSGSGHYSSKSHKFYKYANAAYKTDIQIKNSKCFVYALGFFHNSKGNDLVFGKRLMKDLASVDKYYLVQKPDDLNNTMNDIAKTIINVSINKSTIKFYVGNNSTIKVYKNGAQTNGTWSSSDSSIVSVSSTGVVTGHKVGTATVSVTLDGVTKSCKVTVVAGPITKLNNSSLSIYKGCSKSLKASVTGLSSKVTWTSSNTKIAKVDKNGKVTGIKSGECTITAKANGVSAKCTVKVLNPTIKLNKTSVVLYFKESVTLKATVYGKSSKVTWKTSNSKIATVSKSGKVTAKSKEGSCKITATANGVSATCTIKVEQKHPAYSFYIKHNKVKSNVDGKYINETGGMLKYNDSGKITKAAIYTYKSNGKCSFIVACKGTGLTSVELDCYEGLNGSMIHDYYNTKNKSYHMNHFYLSKDSNDVYSVSSNSQYYGYIYIANSSVSTIIKTGYNGKTFRAFSDLSKMKAWLNE